ncbi:MAG: alpha/beta hydrolase [Acidimicrobiales bacterium]|jgi:pimeloyl-ACP methyl ester carboxylesterase|nr:alpha/beta hydrolase [Acidimicrobiales bacterium]
MSPLRHHAADAHLIRLPDGRSLGYATFGDPDGWPVICNHGGLVCRDDVAPAADAARELGLCLVSPDRPGVGLSGRRPRRSLLDWPEDVAVLLETLGIERFATFGWSLGGPYALALARSLGERVTAVVVVAGTVPLDDPDAFEELNRMDRRLCRLSRKHPSEARAVFQATRELALRSPKRFAKASARELCAADADVVRAGAEWYAAAVAEGLRHPRGVVDEYRVMAAPWGFAPEEVVAAVQLVQGADDTLVPPVWSQRLADRLPTADLTVVDGAGHFVAYGRWRDVLAPLVPS